MNFVKYIWWGFYTMNVLKNNNIPILKIRGDGISTTYFYYECKDYDIFVLIRNYMYEILLRLKSRPIPWLEGPYFIKIYDPTKNTLYLFVDHIKKTPKKIKDFILNNDNLELGFDIDELCQKYMMEGAFI